MSAMTHDGRMIRDMLTMIDERYTRECLADLGVARRLGSYEVIEALADVDALGVEFQRIFRS